MVNCYLVGKVICDNLIDNIQTLTDVRGILVVNLLFLASGICKSQLIIQYGIEFFVGKSIFQIFVYAFRGKALPFGRSRTLGLTFTSRLERASFF